MSNLRAVDAFIALIASHARLDDAMTPDFKSRTSDLSRLIDFLMETPPSRQVRTLHHVMTVFLPNLFTEGVVVDAFTQQRVTAADQLLDELVQIAVTAAQEVVTHRPERALAYRNYCRSTRSPELIRLAA